MFFLFKSLVAQCAVSLSIIGGGFFNFHCFFSYNFSSTSSRNFLEKFGEELPSKEIVLMLLLLLLLLFNGRWMEGQIMGRCVTNKQRENKNKKKKIILLYIH